MSETNEVLNTTPREIVAGTTVEWSESLRHTPADGYTCEFRLAGADAVTISATPSEDNTSFDLRLAPTDTESLATGEYFYQIVTLKDDDVFLETSGEMLVNSLVGTAGYDGRSVAKKIVDAIDALVLNRATIDQQSYQIGTRQLSRIPWADLPATRKYYAAIVDQEERRARLAAGKSLFPSIKLRFS